MTVLGKAMAGVSLLSSFLEGEERIVAEMRAEAEQSPITVISAEAIHVRFSFF